jgi:hypothetical protein
MPRFSSISCREDLNDREEEMTSEGLTASTGLWVRYADRFALCNDLVLGRRRWPYTILPNCICTSAKPTLAGGHPIEVDQGFELLENDWVKVVASYETVTSEREETQEGESTEEKPYSSVVEEFDVAGQFLPLDYKNFVWDDGTPLKEDEAPGLLQSQLSLVRTLKKVRNVPHQILTLPGHVNSSVYTSQYNGLAYGEETLLFIGARLTNTYIDDGSSGFDMTLTFKVHPVSWNKVYSKVTQTWRRIQTYNTTGTLVDYDNYPKANFGWLLNLTGSFE